MDKTTKLIKEAVDAGAVVIAQTEPMTCSDCGKEDELRPYGKNGAWVCYNCGMKDEEEARRQFNKQFEYPHHKPGEA